MYTPPALTYPALPFPLTVNVPGPRVSKLAKPLETVASVRYFTPSVRPGSVVFRVLTVPSTSSTRTITAFDCIGTACTSAVPVVLLGASTRKGYRYDDSNESAGLASGKGMDR